MKENSVFMQRPHSILLMSVLIACNLVPRALPSHAEGPGDEVGYHDASASKLCSEFVVFLRRKRCQREREF